jgi:hypothetical protein
MQSVLWRIDGISRFAEWQEFLCGVNVSTIQARNDGLLRLHWQPTGKFPCVRFSRFLCFLQQNDGQCGNQ